MTSSTPVCGICDSRHIYKTSEVWCSQCDEGLCMDCTEHHRLSKATKHHNTILLTEYQKLPSFVLDIKQFCQEHNEKFRFYCRKDECPCCDICMVEKHEDCKNVAILKDITKIVKKSVQFNKVEQLCDDLMKTIDKIRKKREKNLVHISEQKRIIESEIRDLRTKINNHLDKLQEDLLKELTNGEINITVQTGELLASLDDKKKELTEYQTNVLNIKQYASDLQTFLAMKQLESEIEIHDITLKALVNSDSLRETTLSCRIDKRLKNIITIIEKFGEVVVESKTCEVSFDRRKDKQAQTMVADLPPIDNIQLNLKQKIYAGNKEIRGLFSTFRKLIQDKRHFAGCSFLPDGGLVLSCLFYNTVRFFNKDGVELFQIGKDKTVSAPFDTVYIKDNNSVAVSSLDDACITIIDIESQEVKTTISMDTYVSGMAVRGCTIYCCTGINGLKMLNLSDQSVSDIINDEPYTSYVATFGNKLYYTSIISNTVTCCDLQGKTQWKFNDKRVLEGPAGVTVDNDGNVYVASFYSNTLLVISPDGQRHRQLLSKKDGMELPKVLDYDRSTNRLLVVNYTGLVFLFDVARGQ